MSPAALLLSDQGILNQYLQGAWPTPESNRQQVFQAMRLQEPFQPDFATDSRLLEEGVVTTTSDMPVSYAEQLLGTLQYLAKPLWLRGRAIYVKEEEFEHWQQRLTIVMPLPVISFFAFSTFRDENQAKTHLSEWLKNNSCLPAPYLPALEDLAKQGLTEHHLHIMGTTESDAVWQHAISQPRHMLSDLKKASRNSHARQQLQQVNPILQFSDLYRLLRLASCLRWQLVELIQGKSLLSRARLQCICKSWPAQFSSKHPATVFTGESNSLMGEAFLLHASYQHLARTSCEIAARCLHVYLLLQSLFHRLLSQQLLDKGFKQFENVTQNELREDVERRFSQRFAQLQGMYNHRLALLEARFAPKDTAENLRALLRTLKSCYESSSLNDKTPLTLTAHFIKQKDRPEELQPCRHYLLRKRLSNQKQLLCRYLEQVPEFRDKVIAIDCAGNELHAGPDVFAPLYRDLRDKGFKHFTFHAGEEFNHILSGMRQIYEAVKFLDLKPGDRIGHATAIGIEPAFWLNRSAAEVQVEKGEWLDTLLFAHHLLLNLKDADTTNCAYTLELEIFSLAADVFDIDGLSLPALTTAWLNRWRDPLQLNESSEISDQTKALLTAWHQPRIYERSRALQSIRSDRLSLDLYRKLQINLLGILNEKQLAIEALPTSNLRISYYKKYSEHHLHRWLDPNEPVRPSVVLGSDDPGIFSTNIYNEYAHIILSSRERSGRMHCVAEALFEEGRRFGFYKN